MRVPADTLDDMTRALGANVCVSYRACYEKLGAQLLRERGFDPKTLTVLNLNLRSREGDEAFPQHCLFLSGDGQGNYWFTAAGDSIGKVMVWAHDPPGIEVTGHLLLDFLQTAEQKNRILIEPSPGDVYLSRTEVPGESILDPISLDQWMAVLGRMPVLEYRGYRRGRNPFTGEELRFPCPGGAVGRHDGREVLFRLHCGRVCAADLPEAFNPLLQSLAGMLGARVIRGG
jgi:hypothetical protein